MMKKKNKGSDGQMPWSEAVKLNLRAIRLIKSRYPELVASNFTGVIFGALTPYVGIYMSALIIGELSGGRDPARLTRLVLITLISSAVISLAGALLSKWRKNAGANMWFKIGRLYSEKFLEMDFEKVDDTKIQELYSTLMQNQGGGGWGLTRVAGNFERILSSVFTLLGGIALTATLFTSKIPDSEAIGALRILDNPLISLLIVGLLLAITFISPLLSNKAGSYWAKNADSHNMGNRLFGFFGFLGYNAKLAADVRIYRQDKLCRKYNEDKNGVFSSHGLFARYARGPMGLYSAASAAVSVVFTGAVYLFVCLKAWAGAFGVGAVTQYVGAVTSLSGGLGTLVSNAGDMRNNAAFLRPVFEFFDIKNDMYVGSLSTEKRSDHQYEVELRDVSFKYPASESWALRHVSMSFRVGERLAAVGRNGSGKTTFIKLLCRLYDPTEGEILLNGIDIRKYDYADYMDIFSVVFQDFRLFAFPLAQNVASKSVYDEERVRSCLCEAGFGERLKSLPKGIGTCLYKAYDENGVDVSGGEAQKIAIARSLYKDAPFIILDEPTAALDPVAEYEIYTKFNEIVGGKTAIYISHRLSSCRFCDDIAVFEGGRVVQRGSHDELVEAEGKYRELWYAQAKYYAEKEKNELLTKYL